MEGEPKKFRGTNPKCSGLHLMLALEQYSSNLRFIIAQSVFLGHAETIRLLHSTVRSLPRFLFVPQRSHRIYFCGLAGRQITGRQAHYDQDRCYRGKGQWIGS